MIAADAQETVGENAAVEERSKLALHEPRDGALAIPGPGQKRLEVVGDDAVEDGLFGAPWRVGTRRALAGCGELPG